MARMGGMDRQTLRDWVHRFNDHGPEGLVRPKRSERGPTRSCPNANATTKLLNVRHAGAPASSPGGAGAGRTRRPQPLAAPRASSDMQTPPRRGGVCFQMAYAARL